MINSIEIKEKAREFGVPVSTIERDYSQNLLLKNLNSINMAIKGGTGIRKVFIKNYRFSDDLDFTLLETIRKEEVLKRLERAVMLAKEESGINYFNDVSVKNTESGWKYTIKFQMSQVMKIDIDITLLEKEKIVYPIERRKIIHIFSDRIEGFIKSYSLKEIFIEKLRSLIERNFPRDLYDVWYLAKNKKIEVEREKIIEKFNFKNVKLNSKILLKNKNKILNAWESSLKNQIKDIPEFNRVFEEVMEILKNYKIN